MTIALVAFVDARVLVVVLTVGNWAVLRVDGRVLEKLKSDGRKIADAMHRTKPWRLWRVVWASVVSAWLVRVDMLAQAARFVLVLGWASLQAEGEWAREAASPSLLWVAYALHQSLVGHLLRPTLVWAVLHFLFDRP